MHAIEVNDVSKKYKIFNEKNVTLKEKLVYFGKSKPTEFWALKNINLKIDSGKTVGLIGRNGSGKSTLLKMLTKIIYPTSGSVKLHGKVSSLLELGAGFHPDFTGRENIYMNASILGFTKKEIDERLEEIINFSELNDFIDNTVRSYSSGMYMRLGFSVAIMVNPDILLIDEVLAVGDALFQKKCFEKLDELKRAGKTIVFVSHDHGAVEKMCDEVCWIHEGNLMEIGEPKNVINKYLAFLNKEDEAKNHSSTNYISNEGQATNDLVLNKVTLFDSSEEERATFLVGEDIYMRVDFEKGKHMNLQVQADLYKEDILCFRSKYDINGDEPVTLRFTEPNINKGKYLLRLTVHNMEESITMDTREVELEINSFSSKEGLLELNHKWN